MEVVRKIEASNELRTIEDTTARENSSLALATANTTQTTADTATNVAQSAKANADNALQIATPLTSTVSTLQAELEQIKGTLQNIKESLDELSSQIERKTNKILSISILDSDFTNGKYELTENDKSVLFGSAYDYSDGAGLFLLFTTLDDLDNGETLNCMQLVQYENNKFTTDKLDMGFGNYTFSGKKITITKNQNITQNFRLYALEASFDSEY